MNGVNRLDLSKFFVKAPLVPVVCQDERSGEVLMLGYANEAAVDLFLDGRIGFTEIAERVSHALDSIPYRKDITLDDVLAADRAARELVLG